MREAIVSMRVSLHRSQRRRATGGRRECMRVNSKQDYICYMNQGGFVDMVSDACVVSKVDVMRN